MLMHTMAILGRKRGQKSKRCLQFCKGNLVQAKRNEQYQEAYIAQWSKQWRKQGVSFYQVF